MGRFEKGHSGNPGGKPKSKELREALRGFTDTAVKRLGELIEHKDGRIALLAIRELYDRVYGKALTIAEVSIEDNRADQSELYRQQLTPDEVAVSLKELLTTAEKEMGLEPQLDLSNKVRVERLLQQPVLPPSLYAALVQASGTRH